MRQSASGLQILGAFITPALRYLDFDVAPGRCGIDCADYGSDRSSYPRPAGRRQNNNRKTPVSEVLLVSKVRVGGNHERESFALSRIEQLAVAQLRPAAFVGGGDFVLRQRLAQGRRSTLVEQYAHSGGSQRAPRSVLQDGTDLFDGHTGKPLHEL